MEVVEKGEWDSWFQFEGGGRIHLKMRFSLTKGDRSRVREMVNLIFELSEKTY